MAFWVRYHDGTDFQETELVPAPSSLDYPPPQDFTAHRSDGRVILQRTLRDLRERRWIWRNQSGATYESMWTLLESLETKTRTDAGLPPEVFIWEDVSGQFGDTDAGAKVWTQVRIILVDRIPHPGPIWPHSEITWIRDY